MYFISFFYHRGLGTAKNIIKIIISFNISQSWATTCHSPLTVSPPLQTADGGAGLTGTYTVRFLPSL